MQREDLRNKKIAVLGLGISGFQIAQLLHTACAKVVAVDGASNTALRERARVLTEKGITARLGSEAYRDIIPCDRAVISPGIAPHSPLGRFVRDARIPVFSEIEAAAWFCKSRTIIGVTGTNGKSTTVSVLAHILARAGKGNALAGNIGKAFAEIAPTVPSQESVVLELSSFQLYHTQHFFPTIAAVLNIAENHLDWHRDFQEYLDAKARIFSDDPSQIKVLNYDDQILRERLLPRLKNKDNVYFFGFDESLGQGIVVREDGFFFKERGAEQHICARAPLLLKGVHNLYNIAAAALIAHLCGAKNTCIREVVSSFKGLPHRFEYVDAIGSVSFINDSKSTTPHATTSVLAHFKKPTVLIAGGRNKALDFSSIGRSLRPHVRHMVLIGEAKEEIKKGLASAIPTTDAATLEEAVRTAFTLARRYEREESYVILSPMCTSFDMFKDFEDRGDMFKEAVARLKEAPL